MTAQCLPKPGESIVFPVHPTQGRSRPQIVNAYLHGCQKYTAEETPKDEWLLERHYSSQQYFYCEIVEKMSVFSER